MKKHFFLLIFIICTVLGFTQRPAVNVDGPAENNNCKDIINRLRESHKNDSIAIEIFKSEYKIYYLPILKRDSLLKENYFEIIRFFNSEESRGCECDPKRIKHKKFNYYLIDNR